MLANQNKALQAQLSEMKRKRAESDCKVWIERKEIEEEIMREGTGRKDNSWGEHFISW